MSARKSWLTATLLLSGAIMGGAIAGLWAFQHLDLGLQLRHQPALVSLPSPVPVEARILDNLDIVIDGSIKTVVPVDQVVSLPIRDTLHVNASIDHDIPVRMTVAIRDSIPVDQVVKVNARVAVDILGQTLMLPVRGDVPIKTRVPISLDVPVNQLVRMKFTAPTDVRLSQALQVPLRTNIAATIPVHGELQVPVRSALKAEVSIPEPFPAVLERADLSLPLRSLTLTRRDPP